MAAPPLRFPRRTLAHLGAAVALDALLWARRGTAATAELSVIVHPTNTAKLTADDLGDIFRTVMRSWPGGGQISAFELPPNTDERAMFDRAVLKMEPDDVAHFWIDRRMRGGAPPPHQVPDPGVLLRVVAKLENAVGYVPSDLAGPSVRVVARIRGAQVVIANADSLAARRVYL